MAIVGIAVMMTAFSMAVCRQPHPASELTLIGDGSIKICQACRVRATAMIQE